MPKRKDIKKILVIGAGPIIIGQACEFDYSGTQACKALKDEGYKVILINSNPATIMTDPGVADKTYIEPISLEVLDEVIKKEKPDAILPTMGGQTALNLAINAEKIGLVELLEKEIENNRLELIDSGDLLPLSLKKTTKTAQLQKINFDRKDEIKMLKKISLVIFGFNLLVVMPALH